MSWNDIDIDAFVRELYAADGDDGLTTENGWYTVKELAELKGKKENQLRSWLLKAEKQGIVEKRMTSRPNTNGFPHAAAAYRLTEE